MASRATSFGVGLILSALAAWAALGGDERDRLCVNSHPRARQAVAYPLPALHGFERDHMVPLCLGGATDKANVWYEPLDEAKAKDMIEWEMCQEYCRGKVTLDEAREFFSSGAWRKVLTAQ